MSLCINPNCPKPENPGDRLFCSACGSELWLAGRYRVLHLLGVGGFGKTYTVNDGNTPNVLSKVLKVLINNDAKCLELFQRESAVLSQLNHPGIPRVDPDGYFTFLPRNCQEPLHCLVMEYIEGIDLEAYLIEQRQGPIEQKLALEWLTQLATILHEVHSQQFFHRDIKPSNIMLKPDGLLALIDFGAAREVTGTYMAKVGVGQKLTSIHSFGYTPQEQINGHPLPQSDFFALGRTFVFLLTGKDPNEFYNPLTGECRWRSSTSNLSPLLADLIDELMAPLPGQRPGNTQVILQRLLEIDRALSSPQGYYRPGTQQRGSLAGYPLPLLPSHPLSVSPQWSPEEWASRVELGKIFSGHSGGILSLAIAADGQTMVSGSDDSTIKVWDLNTGNLRHTLMGHAYSVNSVAIAADGQTMVSGGDDSTIKVWDLNAGKLRRTMMGHSYRVYAVATSPDGQSIVSGSADNTLKLWNLNTGQVQRTFFGHSDWVKSVAIASDGGKGVNQGLGPLVVSGSADHTLKVWDLNNGQEVQTLIGHTFWVSSVAITPDDGKGLGPLVVSGSVDKTIKVWSLNTGQMIHTLRGHSAPVIAVAIAPNGKIMVSGSDDKTIKIWNLNTGEELRTLTGPFDSVHAVAFSSEGLTLVSGSANNTIQVWRVP